MIQIYIALVIGFLLGMWACAILTAAKMAAHDAFHEELGEIILKLMEENDNLEDRLAGMKLEIFT